MNNTGRNRYRLQVNEAFKRVKANKGSSGIDGISIEQVASNPRKYLYPLWNRMSSGSYLKAVRRGTDSERRLW
ncbi:MAG: hypothetical protein M9911_06790 [Saprospiraceae bacterium]|nr:hypothetical protein [Saprospiraceae bacterium]